MVADGPARLGGSGRRGAVFEQLEIGVAAAQEELPRRRALETGDSVCDRGEVISSFARQTVADARREVPGEGPEHVAAVVERVLVGINSFEPMHRFLDRDPEYALRFLTSKESTVQRGSVELIRELLSDQVRVGALETPIELEDVAHVIIRIGESFLYSDVIIGSEPNVEVAGQMVRLLLGASR